MTKTSLACAILIATLVRGFASQYGAKGTVTVVIPRVEKGPTLTGTLSDPVWQKGALLRQFKNIETGKTVAWDTEAFLLYDSDYLYVGVKCHDIYADKLVSEVKEHDGPVWRDDCIELLLDTQHNHRTAFHIAVNTIGTVADARRIFDDREDTAWTSDAQVKTSVVGGAWVAELAIPFKALGVQPVPGLVWGLNICRQKRMPPRELSAWSNTPGGFIRPNNFGHAVLGGDDFGIKLLTWGNLDSDNLFGGENVLELEISNSAQDKRVISAILESSLDQKQRTLAEGNINVPRGQTSLLKLPYTPSGNPHEVFTLKVLENGKLVMSATNPSAAVPPKPRVWQLEDPLFEQLLSSNAPGDQKNGAIYWFHSGNEAELRAFAKEYGLRYSYEEAFEELATKKLMPIVQTQTLKSETFQNMADKYGFKALLEPDFRQAAKQGAPALDGMPYIFDPRCTKAYLDDLKATVQQYRKYLWGIYSWDELFEIAINKGLDFNFSMRESYPFIREVEESIKKEFGYGKYGFPDTAKESDPFAWIAYRKWVNRRLCEFQKEIYENTKKIAPELKVVSFDATAGHKPYELDALAPYVDIVTHQLYPSGNENRQEFGFVTKFVADLTGKPVWPCTHVENYAYSTTAEETRELMSQVMRNGGKGFHLYLQDVRGQRAQSGDTKLTKYGCPERYTAITQIVDLASRMNEVAIPTDPDSAILYSEDHYQSFPAFTHTYSGEPEYAYTFLGPVARTWFRFVNDNMVANGKVNLKAFKAVFVPAAKYERRKVVEQLLEYVRSGGKLVCADPEAFMWSPDGTSLGDLRKDLFGVEISQAKDEKEIVVADSNIFGLPKDTRLPINSPAFAMTPSNAAQILATFSGGGPAVIRHKVGKGYVILFASNPFTEQAVGNPAWKDLFKRLAEDLGLKTGRDIWRFKFPPMDAEEKDPQGICLTGNYIRWQQERPIDVRNAAIPGTYSYSLPADKVIDEAGEIRIPFTKGNLTDRKIAPCLDKKVLAPERFVVTWKRQDPVSVEFDFAKSYPLNSVRLWYSDQLPELTVEVSTDAQTWVQMATCPKQQPTKDVLDVTIPLRPENPCRYLRLNFGERDEGEMMTLVECEVWADSLE